MVNFINHIAPILIIIFWAVVSIKHIIDDGISASIARIISTFVLATILAVAMYMSKIDEIYDEDHDD